MVQLRKTAILREQEFSASLKPRSLGTFLAPAPGREQFWVVKNLLPWYTGENKQKRGRIMKLVHGRPENMEERLPKEVRVYDFLDNLAAFTDNVLDFVRVDFQ